MLRRVVLGASLVWITSAIFASFAQTSDEIAIRARALTEAFNMGDAQAVGDFYNADAMAMPPNQAVAEGREAIINLWQSYIDAGISSLRFVSIEINVFDGVAYEVGGYSMEVLDPTDNGRAEVKGKYLVIWDRDDSNEKWRIHRQMWSVNPSEGQTPR